MQPIETSGREPQPSSLSLAIARRIFLEEEKGQLRVAQLLGLERMEIPEEERGRRVTQNAISIDKELATTNPTIARAIFLNSYYKRLSYSLQDYMAADTTESSGLTEEEIQSSSRFSSELYADSFVNSLTTNEEDPYDINAAREIAEEAHTSIENVFNNEVLYRRLLRKVSSPVQVVQDSLSIVAPFTPEYTANMIIQIGLQEADREFSSEEIEQMKLDPRVQVEARETVMRMKRAYATLAREEVISLWGIEAFDELPEELKQQIDIFADKSNNEKEPEP